MVIQIEKKDLEDIDLFINKKLVHVMNDFGLSINAMAFILQTLMDATKELDKE